MRYADPPACTKWRNQPGIDRVCCPIRMQAEGRWAPALAVGLGHRGQTTTHPPSEAGSTGSDQKTSHSFLPHIPDLDGKFGPLKESPRHPSPEHRWESPPRVHRDRGGHRSPRQETSAGTSAPSQKALVRSTGIGQFAAAFSGRERTQRYRKSSASASPSINGGCAHMLHQTRCFYRACSYGGLSDTKTVT